MPISGFSTKPFDDVGIERLHAQAVAIRVSGPRRQLHRAERVAAEQRRR